MYKHIKYETSLSEDLSEVFITILEQTHVSNKFGPTDFRFFNSEFILCSVAYPAWEGDPTRCYLHGSRPDMHNEVIKMPVAVYPKFKAAVVAYNYYFGKW